MSTPFLPLDLQALLRELDFISENNTPGHFIHLESGFTLWLRASSVSTGQIMMQFTPKVGQTQAVAVPLSTSVETIKMYLRHFGFPVDLLLRTRRLLALLS